MFLLFLQKGFSVCFNCKSSFFLVNILNLNEDEFQEVHDCKMKILYRKLHFTSLHLVVNCSSFFLVYVMMIMQV